MKRFLIASLALMLIWWIIEGILISRKLELPPSHIGYFILLDRSGVVMTQLGSDGWYSIPYSGTFKSPIVNDIIEIEDRRFYSHFGIDLLSKFNVLWESIRMGRVTRWWSTITEQFIKNSYFPDAPRTFKQKIREWFWALIAEYKYSKEELLSKYLETSYMGNGIYGVPAAIEQYFSGVDESTLSSNQIVEIIVRLRYPNLGGSSETYRTLISERLSLAIEKSPIPKREKQKYPHLFPFLTERIKKELNLYCDWRPSTIHHFIYEISSDLCKTSYVRLRTSIDSKASKYASDTLSATLYPLEEKNVHNGSIYAWSEKEKKVLLYIWNRHDSTGNSYDMIVRKRSVGSILKPFLYLVAYHNHDPNDFILDEKKVYETGNEWITYLSENYIPKAYGPIPLKSALGNSLNSATVRLTEDIGVSRFYASLRSLGFELDHDASYYGYGIALWAIELSLESIVQWYRQIMDLTDRENFLLYDTLSDSRNRSMTFWASSILNTSLPLAVKTWTSTDFRDNWTVGYNDEVAIGVWVGNTDGSSMDDVSWVTGAGPIFHRIAEDLIERWYINKKAASVPNSVEKNSLCLDEKCFQKEMTFTKSEYERRSRPASNLYYVSDFVTPLTSEEKENWKIR
jgi:penicillin-binding protein 1C